MSLKKNWSAYTKLNVTNESDIYADCEELAI